MQSYVNSVQFKGYVPLSKYSGKPKLSESSIKQIKFLKSLIKDAENDLFECEFLAKNPFNHKHVNNYWLQVIALLKQYKSKLATQVTCVRKYNEYDPTDTSELISGYKYLMSEIEKQFNDYK